VCGQGLAPFDQTALLPQHVCTPCGFDLRRAAAPHLRGAALRTASVLADLGQRITSDDAATLDAILRLPAHLDPPRAAALTTMSASERARHLPEFARLIAALAATTGVARLNLDPRNFGRVTPGRKPAGREIATPPAVSLHRLLSAYAVVQRRRAVTPPIRDPARPR
jgi:hypothetical protein